jgi:hypothetical protein
MESQVVHFLYMYNNYSLSKIQNYQVLSRQILSIHLYVVYIYLAKFCF